MRIEKATTEYIVLQCGAQPNHKEYSVWVNVCEEKEICPGAIKVVVENTWEGLLIIRWEDIGKTAQPGHTAWMFWSCTVRAPGGGLVIFMGRASKTVVGEVFLPMTMKDWTKEVQHDMLD